MVQMKVSTVSIVYETFALTLMYMHTQVLVPLALIVLLFRRGMVQIRYECIFSEKVFCFVPLNFTKMQEFEGEYDIPDKYTGRYVFDTSVATVIIFLSSDWSKTFTSVVYLGKEDLHMSTRSEARLTEEAMHSRL